MIARSFDRRGCGCTRTGGLRTIRERVGQTQHEDADGAASVSLDVRRVRSYVRSVCVCGCGVCAYETGRIALRVLRVWFSWRIHYYAQLVGAPFAFA